MPPTCKICPRENVSQIDTRIRRGESLRYIALQELGAAKHFMSVNRHAENCLKLTIQAAIKEQRIERAIDVYEEFREQLTFAKELRLAAREYLSDANDPLKLSITPKAHEIEVTYFDHDDLEVDSKTGAEHPKKKVAQLSIILESIFAAGSLEPDKYKITTIDIRKFALDAINTTDTCIDKFAKMGGKYTKEMENPQTPETVARAVLNAIKDAREEDILYTMRTQFSPDEYPSFDVEAFLRAEMPSVKHPA